MSVFKFINEFTVYFIKYNFIPITIIFVISIKKIITNKMFVHKKISRFIWNPKIPWELLLSEIIGLLKASPSLML